MHAVIRRYMVEPKNLDAIFDQLEAGFLPHVTRAPGFVSYRAGVTGKREVVTLTTFDSVATARAAALAAAPWAAEHLRPLLIGEPEVFSGEVLIRTLDPQQSWRYAVIRRYRLERQLVREAARFVEDEFVPILTRLRGFALYMWVDNEDGIVISISGFRDRAAADASTVTAEWWRQGKAGELFPSAPDIIELEARVSSAR